METLDTADLVATAIGQLTVPDYIEVRVEGQLPRVVGERTRLNQVFQNLIGNAIEYMDKPKGQIRIAAAEADGFWRFSVADNGPGIEEKHFDRIFQMFQTLSSPDRGGSTGLGLAVVKKIVEIHGGHIWIESDPGVGSTFLFTLPQDLERTENGRHQTCPVG
jgi:signal transduction histidine kinase